MATNAIFHYEVERSGDDEHHNKVTSVKCHGKFVAENADEQKDLVKPLIPLGGRIVIDVSDLGYLDSASSPFVDHPDVVHWKTSTRRIPDGWLWLGHFTRSKDIGG
jgi:hypothetical protein